MVTWFILKSRDHSRAVFSLMFQQLLASLIRRNSSSLSKMSSNRNGLCTFSGSLGEGTGEVVGESACNFLFNISFSAARDSNSIFCSRICSRHRATCSSNLQAREHEAISLSPKIFSGLFFFRKGVLLNELVITNHTRPAGAAYIAQTAILKLRVCLEGSTTPKSQHFLVPILLGKNQNNHQNS